MKVQVLVILALALSLVSPCSDTSSCFIKRLFDFKYPEQNIYNISLTPQDGSLNNVIMGYGDFNKDLHADYVAFDPSSNQTLIFEYQNGGDNDGQYTVLTSLPIFQGCTPLSAYLYDVNLDGILDISIWGQYSNGSNCLYPILQSDSHQFAPGLDAPSTYDATTQPILFETSSVMQGAKTTCLLLFDAQAQARKIVYFNNDAYVSSPWNSTFQNSNENLAFSDQHWNSFVDITGDCSSDIIITNANSQIEFWIYTKNKFTLVLTVELKDLSITSLTSLSFVDANYNGVQDIILTTSNTIMVFKSTEDAPEEFCLQGKTTFGYNWKAPVSVPAPANCQLQPQNIHFGDLNIDGYPDLIFTCKAGDNIQVKAFENNFDQSGGSFIQFTSYQNAFDSFINSKLINVTRVSIFDVLQNGITDIMVTLNSNSTMVLYNNYLYQNYFYIKGFATNGASDNTGTQIPGATFYWLNSLGNSQRVAVYSQMFQSAYGAVPMPYVLTGLGKANNYVQQFTIGRLGQSRSWSPIIPNSQLALFAGSQSTDNWIIKIFIMPTDSIVYVLIVCIVILALLGGVLIFLKCRHKKDENLLYGDYM